MVHYLGVHKKDLVVYIHRAYKILDELAVGQVQDVVDALYKEHNGFTSSILEATSAEEIHKAFENTQYFSMFGMFHEVLRIAAENDPDGHRFALFRDLTEMGLFDWAIASGFKYPTAEIKANLEAMVQNIKKLPDNEKRDVSKLKSSFQQYGIVVGSQKPTPRQESRIIDQADDLLERLSSFMKAYEHQGEIIAHHIGSVEHPGDRLGIFLKASSRVIRDLIKERPDLHIVHFHGGQPVKGTHQADMLQQKTMAKIYRQISGLPTTAPKLRRRLKRKRGPKI